MGAVVVVWSVDAFAFGSFLQCASWIPLVARVRFAQVELYEGRPI